MYIVNIVSAIKKMTVNKLKHFIQLFRTNARILLGPDAFDQSKFVMTFLTILGVIEILYSFTLVLEGKTGKETPE